jgi:hypothetical protein
MDELPMKAYSGMSLIVNLQNSDQPGSHWVAVVVAPTCCYYFDPFGIAPPTVLSRWMKAYKNLVKMNDSQLQHIESHRCGLYCYYFIKEMALGRPIYDVLYRLSQEPSNQNEHFIDQYYHKS